MSAEDHTIDMARPTRDALVQNCREAVQWLTTAARIFRDQFEAEGTAHEYEDRAKVLQAVISAEDWHRQHSTFARDGYLNTKEAAEYCGLSHKTLEKYRDLGTGPLHHRDGDGKRARVYYLPSELDDWMNANMKQVAPAAE